MPYTFVNMNFNNQSEVSPCTGSIISLRYTMLRWKGSIDELL